jgi:hypothetical protein
MNLFEDVNGVPRVEDLPTAALIILKRFCDFSLSDWLARYNVARACREFSALKREGRRVLAALEEAS